jgi:hypothetical protein
MTTALYNPDRHPPTGVATDPLPARLSLVSVSHAGPLDGVWWPRSRQPATELSALAAVLAARGVVVTRLFLSVTGWDKTPGRLRLADRDVRLVWFAYQSWHTVVVEHGSGRITLLVVPPSATEQLARRAVTLVSDPHSVAGPDDILTACKGVPEVRSGRRGHTAGLRGVAAAR